MRRALVVVGVTCLLSQGCAGNPSIPVVAQVQVPEVTALSAGAPSRVVIFDRLVFDVPKGTVIGEVRRGNLCLFPEKLLWQAEPLIITGGMYHGEFDRVMAAYNFRVPDKPTSLFDRPKLSGTELFVAARIPSLQENRCSGIDVWHANRSLFKGNIKLFVHWEVFSVAEQKVVLAVDTEGSAVGDEFKPPSEHNYWVRAFGNALRALLANEEFRRLAMPARGARR